ncbi:MAG: FG-GAP-like repeat-containing protein [Calditrichia bacterium]
MKHRSKILSALMLCINLVMAQTFTDMSSLLQPADPGGTRSGQRGASAADFNNDGLVDLYLANFRASGKLYLNRGSAGFTDELNRIGIDEGTNMWGAAFGDYNDDGYFDILFEDLSAPSKLYKNDRSGGFTEVNDAAGVSILTLAQGAAWDDFNRDGKLDFFIVNDIGPNQLFKNLDYETFDDISISAGVQTSGNSYGVSWGDINNDGYPDAYIATCHPSDPLRSINHLLINNGDETFTNIAQAAGVADSLAGWGVVMIDYDGDLDFDIYVTNSEHPPRLGDNRLYQNDGNNQFSRAAANAGVAGDFTENSYGNAVADFNNDGWEDMYVSNLGQRDRLYINNGDGTFTDIAETAGIPVNEHRAMAVADLNNDGWIDVFSGGVPTSALYYNNGGSNHWLRLSLRGITNNYSGIGATMYLHSGGRVQMKAMRAGDSFCSQSHSITTHFGLGSATTVDSLIVVWPNGVRDRINNITQVDRHVAFVEGGTLNSRPSTFELTAPANGDTLDTSSSPLVFEWTAATDLDGNALSYSLHLRGTDLWTGALFDTSIVGISTTSYAPGANELPGNHKWRWSVDVSDGTEITAAMDFCVITVDPFGFVFELSTAAPGGAGTASQGLSWGDFDADGDADIYIVNAPDAANALFENDGNGNFSTVSAGAAITDIASSFSATWGDYDNDGLTDVFVANINQQNNQLYRNLGNGSFESILSGAIVNDQGNSFGAAWVDYDNDGLLDLHVVNDTQNPSFLYRNNGNGFDKITTGDIATDNVYSLSSSWSDYDNDGDMDVFLANTSPNFLYQNNGNGTFTKITSGDIVSGFGSSRTGAWSDYDNDGDMDLFVANSAIDYFYDNNGDGTFTRIFDYPQTATGNDSRGAVWGDFNNDGFSDLLVLYQTDAAFFLNNGNKSFTEIAALSSAASFAAAQGMATADIDLDGRLDVLISDASTNGDNYQLKNSVPSGNWLLIGLTGNPSNTSAIGAKVRARTSLNSNIVWQMREITGQASLASQNDATLHFGLGNSAIVDSLIVEWPSGYTERIANIAINQKLEITEQFVAAVEPQPGVASSFYLQQNYPNPFNPQTTIRYGLPKASAVTLEVFNLLGQKVSTLINENQAAGNYQIKLNASDYVSGVYVYRLTTGGHVFTRKMVVLR